MTQAADWKALAANRAEWGSLKHDDPRLDAFAHEVENRYGLPRGVLEALKNAGERTPSKDSGRPTVSSAGAEGLMQFIPPTRKAYQHNPDDPFESLDAAGRLMADEIPRHKGNVMAAIAAYNGGTAAGRAVLEGKEPPAEETREYLKRIRSYMSKKYGDGK